MELGLVEGGRTAALPVVPDDALIARTYTDNAAALTRYARTFVRDDAAAEDLVHEAFLRLAREVRDARTPDNPAAWLFRVTANLATSRARRAAVAARFADVLDRPEAAPDPEDLTIDGERYEALRDALDDLAPPDRTALLMAAHGYRGPEIAKRLGRTQLATRTLLCRARGRVRARLTAQGFAA
jgi:RNA polymerase sigma-70 factor (ECF subfamily)